MSYTPKTFLENWRKDGLKSAWNEDKKVTRESIHEVLTLTDVLLSSTATVASAATFYLGATLHNSYRLQIPLDQAMVDPSPGAIFATGVAALGAVVHMRERQRTRYGNNLHQWVKEVEQETFAKKRQQRIDADTAYAREVQLYKIEAMERDCDRYQRLAIADFDRLTAAMHNYEETKVDEFFARVPTAVKHKDARSH
jgi:hypothetical protein